MAALVGFSLAVRLSGREIYDLNRITLSDIL
jgi:hypothetical protein